MGGGQLSSFCSRVQFRAQCTMFNWAARTAFFAKGEWMKEKDRGLESDFTQRSREDTVLIDNRAD
jgi:hypothetical protein